MNSSTSPAVRKTSYSIFDRARLLAEEQTSALQAEAIALTTYDKQIQASIDRQNIVDQKTQPFTDADRAFMDWAESGFEGDAPAFNLNTESAVKMIRAQFAPNREAAERVDPTTKRRYAVMPPTK